MWLHFVGFSPESPGSVGRSSKCLSSDVCVYFRPGGTQVLESSLYSPGVPPQANSCQAKPPHWPLEILRKTQHLPSRNSQNDEKQVTLENDKNYAQKPDNQVCPRGPLTFLTIIVWFQINKSLHLAIPSGNKVMFPSIISEGKTELYFRTDPLAI